MNMAAITRNEWKMWQQREDAVLRARTGPGLYDSFPLSATGGAVKRRAPTWKEITASAGGVTSKNLVFLVPDANLPEGVTPRVADQLQDLDEIDHTILEVQAGKFGQTHRCVTIALAVVYELAATGVLTRPTVAQDDAGRAALSAYTTVGTTKCRVQPEGGQSEEVHGRKTMPKRYSGYLETPFVPRAKDVFTVTSYTSPGGAVASVVRYTVTGFRNPEALDQLLTLDLELID